MLTILECLVTSALLSAVAWYLGAKWGYYHGIDDGVSRGVREVLEMQAMGVKIVYVEDDPTCQCADCVAIRKEAKP